MIHCKSSSTLRIAIAVLIGITAQPLTGNDTVEKKEPPQGLATQSFDVSTQLDSFELVWQTIKDSHWDPTVVGERWDRERQTLRPAIERCTNISEVRDVLRRLLATLEQSHCAVIPSEEVSALEEQSKRGGPGTSGLTARYVDGSIMITNVEEGSPAEAAGIQPGWSVVSWTKTKVHPQEVDAEAVKANAFLTQVRNVSKHDVTRPETAIGMAATGALSGSIGQVMTIEFLDTHDVKQTKRLELVKGSSAPARLGNLPITNVRFDSRRLDQNIGYVAFNAFLDPVRLMNGFERAVTVEHADADGLVIDLRGNIGGLMLMTQGMTGWFANEPVSLGCMTMKSTPLRLNVNPRKPIFSAPIAVLIDECSISAAEIYAGGLRDLGIARVFGQRSAGLVLPSNLTKLPNGDVLLYAMASYRSSSGKVLEGNGVEPHETIALSRDSLSRESDPTLSAAIRWIANEKRIDSQGDQ